MRKNRIIYSLVVVILFIFIYLHEAPMTYAAFFASLLLPIISFIMLKTTKNKIKVTHAINNQFTPKNEKIKYKVQIQNKGFLPCFFAQMKLNATELGLDTKTDIRYFTVAPFSSTLIEYTISGEYRGVYPLEISQLLVYDFLGIFKTKPQAPKIAEFVVAPDIISLDDFRISVLREGDEATNPNRKGQDLSMVSELRKFLPTDNYRHIHWKATAKRGELISKEALATERPQAVMFIDNNRLAGDCIKRILKREDKLISTVAAIIFASISSGHAVNIQSQSFKDNDFSTDFDQAYQLISLIPFGDNPGFHELVQKYFMNHTHPENIYLFTQSITDELIQTLKTTVRLGVKVTLFNVGTVSEQDWLQLQSLDVEVRSEIVEDDETVSKFDELNQKYS